MIKYNLQHIYRKEYRCILALIQFAVHCYIACAIILLYRNIKNLVYDAMVVGNGLSSAACVYFLRKRGRKVFWVSKEKPIYTRLSKSGSATKPQFVDGLQPFLFRMSSPEEIQSNYPGISTSDVSEFLHWLEQYSCKYNMGRLSNLCLNKTTKDYLYLFDPQVLDMHPTKNKLLEYIEYEGYWCKAILSQQIIFCKKIILTEDNDAKLLQMVALPMPALVEVDYGFKCCNYNPRLSSGICDGIQLVFDNAKNKEKIYMNITVSNQIIAIEMYERRTTILHADGVCEAISDPSLFMQQLLCQMLNLSFLEINLYNIQWSVLRVGSLTNAASIPKKNGNLVYFHPYLCGGGTDWARDLLLHSFLLAASF